MNETLNTLLDQAECPQLSTAADRDEDLNAVLKAGMYPQRRNRHVRPFHRRAEQGGRDVISRIKPGDPRTDSDPYYGAPTVVLVLADKTKDTPLRMAASLLATCSSPPVPSASVLLGPPHTADVRDEEGKALLRKWAWRRLRRRWLLRSRLSRGRIPGAALRKANFVVMVK